MEQIKQYWENNALLHGQSHWASWGDHYAIDLEVECIADQIMPGDYILDVGCANGHATQKQFQKHKGVRIIGVDYSSQMIHEAKKNNKESGIEYRVGDILRLDFPDETFDVVYTTRTLINLPTWEEQMRGIRECIRVTKKGGVIILSEGFWEPLMKLNALRLVCGLGPLQEHDFNRYLKQSKLDNFLYEEDLLYAIDEFSTTYYIGSRLLRELFTDTTKYKGYDNPINELFFELSQKYRANGLGIQVAYIIMKD